MLTTPKAKGGLFLASSLCDGVEDNDIKQVTTLLLNKEADPNILIPSHGVTPFHLVIGNDSEAFAEEVTKLFLRHGGDPNVRSVDGMTPVHVAAAWGRARVLELLLANGGDPLRLDDDGRSPFHYAFDGKYYKAVAILGKYCGKKAAAAAAAAAADDDDDDDDGKTSCRISYGKPLIDEEDARSENALEKSLFNVTSSQEAGPCSSYDEFPCSSGSGSGTVSPVGDTGTRKNQQRETPTADSGVMEKERCLVNAIIDQLSTSLANSNDVKLFNAKGAFYARRTPYVESRRCSNDSPLKEERKENVSSRNYESHSSDARRKFRKHSIAPKYRCRILGESKNGRSRSPRSPLLRASKGNERDDGGVPSAKLYDPNDSFILSKSPNLLLSCEGKKRTYFSPQLFGTRSRRDLVKAYTPCVSRNKSFRAGEPFGREMARSTPRRKKVFCRNYGYVGKFERRSSRREKSSDSFETSPCSLSSLSPDLEGVSDVKPRFRNGLAVKLDESKYDEAEDTSFTPARSFDESDRREEFQIPADSSFPGKKDCSRDRSRDRSRLQNRLVPNDYSREKCRSDRSERSERSERSDDDTKEKFTVNLEPLRSVPGRVEEEDQPPNENCDEFEVCASSLASFRSQSLVSVQEEYKYEDPDEGVALLERRLYVLPSREPLDSLCRRSSAKMGEAISSFTIPMELLSITDNSLRRKLIKLGDSPGPITKTTRQVYIKRLVKLEGINGSEREEPDYRKDTSDVGSFLAFGDWVYELSRYKSLEKETFEEYSNPVPGTRSRERGGLNKMFFNYLLLDSRVTKDLACRAINLTDSELWSTFVSAIFYIGKGKRSRPYDHLYDAFHIWVSMRRTSRNEKIQRILDIWNAGYGVVCLHVFQNAMSEEAFTREAVMIEALGLERLTNRKAGEYYGAIATWDVKKKRLFGRYLLYKACHILTHEGERQLFPEHL